MRTIRLWILFGLLYLGASSVIYADLMLGQVQRIFTDRQDLVLSVFNPEAGVFEDKVILISPLTKLEGINTPSELNVGDHVVVDAEKVEGTENLQVSLLAVRKIFESA